MDSRIRDTLQACGKAASSGYKIATTNKNALQNVIAESERYLQEVITKTGGKTAKVPESCESFLQQTKDAIAQLKQAQQRVEQELGAQDSSLSLFNVVIYGRTKAGKSTLMEVLTKGDGASIGLGAQRTTLDVRKYQWNGLTIYDTPGIAASQEAGREDEAKAYEVAQLADLLIFLVSDDAPQQEEAAAFARLKQLGKPMLGIINVKSSSSERSFSKMRLRDMRKKLQNERLDALKNQFMQLATAGDAKWENVHFVYTDLHAAFLAQLQDEALSAHSQELYELSRFAEVEEVIISEIQQKGSFFMYKNFIDIIYQPSYLTERQLRQQSNGCACVIENLKQGEQRLQQIKCRLEKDARERIENFLANLERQLNNLAKSFANNNYENKYANEEWRSELESWQIGEQAQNLLQNIALNCEEQLKEFAKDLGERLRFSPDLRFQGIDGDKIVDTLGRFRLALGVGGVAFAGGVALGLLSLSNPIGWVIGALSLIGGWLFTSKEEKIRKAIRKMRDALEDNVREIVRDLRSKMFNVLQQQIIENYLDKVVENFSELITSLEQFRDAQQNMGRGLNANLLQMNKQLLQAAAAHLKQNALAENVLQVARVPGEAVLLEVKNSLNNKQNSSIKALQELLQEEVLLVPKGLKPVALASQVLGIATTALTSNAEKKELKVVAAHIRNRRQYERMVGLVEQLTGYVVQVEGTMPDYIAPQESSQTTQQENRESAQESASEDAHREILAWYDPNADLEDKKVQWDVARHYALGEGIAQDEAEAFKWALKAAEQGNIGEAQSYVGDCYYFGMGTKQDYKEAFTWYEIAAESGFAAAYKYLGDCYYFGEGTAVDYVKAADCYELAAGKEIAEAAFNLGNAYYYQQGREQKYGEAVKWYRKANSNAGAQNNLGNCYYEGLGLKQNYATAHNLYTEAMRKGCAEARENLQNLFNYNY